MPFSSSLPTWNKTATAPTTTKQNTGWAAGEKPPASIFDWFFNTTFLALQELQQEAINIDQKGAANGIAPLDSLFRVPIGNLPTSDSITYNGVDKVATANSVKMAIDWVKGYGLGTKGQTTTDLNTAILSGFYYVQPGSTNGPTANVGSLIVGGGNGFLTQMFTDFNTGSLHVRRQYSDVWQPWKEIATKEYVDTKELWTDLTLINGATVNNSRPPKFKKQGELVTLIGEVTNTTGIIGYLPAGYRPKQYALNFRTALATSLSPSDATVAVGLDGSINILATGGSSAVSLAGVTFMAEQ